MTLTAILAALSLLGAPKSMAAELAPALLKYAKTPAEAAVLMTLAKHEADFSEDIAQGRCKPFQCDAHRLADGTVEHRARGLFQLHRGAAGKDWDELPGNIDAQVRSAARMARWAHGQCGTVVGTFRKLGALGCDRALPGEEKRMASYRRALGVIK